MDLKIEYLPISALKPYEKNTRKHGKKDVANIAESIKRYGMNDPIGVWGDENTVVEGHGRLLACKQLGIETVPVLRLDHMTDEQRREYSIAHNRTAEFSEWDLPVLELEMFDLDVDFLFEDEIVEKEKVEKESGFESMELKAFEHYDYIVFVFNNTFDWLNAVNQFGIKKVDAGYGRTKKIGVGRVVRGERLLEKIRHTYSNNQQGESTIDTQ